MLDRHPRRKGGGPSDGICLTPGGGIYRSFLHPRGYDGVRWRSDHIASLPPVAQLNSTLCLPFLHRARRPSSNLGLKASAMVSDSTAMFSRSSRVVISSISENY